MRLSRLPTLAWRLAVASIRDRGFRQAVVNELVARDISRTVSASDPSHPNLLPTSSLLAGIATRSDVPGTVNLVVGGVRPGSVFAGIDTALTVAAALSRRLGTGCRVVTTEAAPPPGTGAELSARYGAAFEVVAARDVGSVVFGADDIWIATHFLTAHAVQLACEAGAISARRVVYLVQDYEPGFVPWSTDSVLAQATYHAGFTLLVNSEPVAAHLRRVEGLTIPDGLVLAPRLPLDRLAELARARPERVPARLAFYGRPTRARNLYGLGLAALTLAVDQLGPRAREIEFVSMGAPTAPVTLGPGVVLRPGEKLAWDDYYAFLGQTDVVVSLQQSPHPSHPPLEAALSGAVSITNEFEGSRAALHPGLRAVSPTVESLAGAIVDALADRPRRPVVADLSDPLGVTLDLAVDAVLQALGATGADSSG